MAHVREVKAAALRGRVRMSDLSGRPYTGWPSSVIPPSVTVRDTGTGKK
jgi:hypothetical protein